MARHPLSSDCAIFIGFVRGWQWTGLRIALGLPLVFGVNLPYQPFAVAPRRMNCADGGRRPSIRDSNRPQRRPLFKRCWRWASAQVLPRR